MPAAWLMRGSAPSAHPRPRNPTSAFFEDHGSRQCTGHALRGPAEAPSASPTSLRLSDRQTWGARVLRVLSTSGSLARAACPLIDSPPCVCCGAGGRASPQGRALTPPAQTRRAPQRAVRGLPPQFLDRTQGNIEGIPETAGLGPGERQAGKVRPHLAPHVLGSRLPALAKAASIPE